MSAAAALAIGGAAIVAVAALMRAAAVSPADLQVSRIDVAVRGLGAAFDGYTIVALADIHQWPGEWPGSGLALLERAVAASNAARPDLVALLGDYSVSLRTMRRFNARWYERAMSAMGPLLTTLRATDGVVGVLGNHDHYHDPAPVTAWLASLGVRPLVNGCLTLRRGDDDLVVCGVDDAQCGRVDLDGAAAGAPDAPTIVLSHNPDGVLMLGASRRVDLVLAGHTHGGQYVLPGIGPLTTHSAVCTRAAAAGWVPNERAPLYVSRGIGTQAPGRIGSRPEVVVVVLRRMG